MKDNFPQLIMTDHDTWKGKSKAVVRQFILAGLLIVQFVQVVFRSFWARRYHRVLDLDEKPRDKGKRDHEQGHERDDQEED